MTFATLSLKNQRFRTLYLPFILIAYLHQQSQLTALVRISHILLSRSPQSYYEDRSVAVGSEESGIENELARWGFSAMKYTIIIPTFVSCPRHTIVLRSTLL